MGTKLTIVPAPAPRLTATQQHAFDALPDPKVVHAWNADGTVAVYVYGAISVARFLIAKDGDIAESDRFRAGDGDRRIRRELLDRLAAS